MGDVLITFVKQSSAYKLKKAAKMLKINVKVVQTPKELSAGGCSYAVLARRSDKNKLIDACRDFNIEYRRVLAIYSDVKGKRIYSDI